MRHAPIVLLSAAALVLAGAARPRPASDLGAAHARAEAVRLRAHFDSVDAELRGRDVSGLSATQRAARTRLIAWLRDYRDAGAFPVNDRLPASAPSFRDSRGALCAMAYLIDRSGRGDIVDRVARTRDNAYIAELVDDTALVAWLDASGLDAAEAAHIQPTYGPPPTMPEASSGNRLGYVLGAVGLGLTSVVTTAANLAAPSHRNGMTGTIVGAATIVVGATHFGDDEAAVKRIARAATVAGAFALVTGVHALVRPDAPPRAAGRVQVAPTLGARGGLGLALRARF